MTDEQILELATYYFYDEGGYEWSGTSEDIIAFARAMYEKGDENGWESREQVEYFNRPSYPTGLYGDP